MEPEWLAARLTRAGMTCLLQQTHVELVKILKLHNNLPIEVMSDILSFMWKTDVFIQFYTTLH
jgi:hypothetical protein